MSASPQEQTCLASATMSAKRQYQTWRSVYPRRDQRPVLHDIAGGIGLGDTASPGGEWIEKSQSCRFWVMLFTIEFFRLREEDDAHATLDRITQIGSDLEAVKVKAKSLFKTLNMPQKPDGLRILDQDGDEVFFWTPGADDA